MIRAWWNEKRGYWEVTLTLYGKRFRTCLAGENTKDGAIAAIKKYAKTRNLKITIAEIYSNSKIQIVGIIKDNEKKKKK